MVTQNVTDNTDVTQATADSDTSTATTAFTHAVINAVMPIGMIAMWSGTIATIPTGWALCDGGVHSGVTVLDFRDNFVVGATSTYAVGATGGAATVTLTTAQMPSHNHSVSLSTNTTGSNHRHTYPLYGISTAGGSNAGGNDTSLNRYITTSGPSVTTHTYTLTELSIGGDFLGGGTNPHRNFPPYYALAFIQRVV
jgi:microcystin-dependent protein